MKTSNSCHWLIAVAITIFSFNVYSMGAGGRGNSVLTCPAGYKVENVRSGRTYMQQCVVDTATMSRPEYNREGNRAPQSGSSSSSSSSTGSKKSTTKKSATKPKAKKSEKAENSCGDGFKPSSDGSGCVPSEETDASRERRESSGVKVEQDEGNCGDGGCSEQTSGEQTTSPSSEFIIADTNCGCPDGTTCTKDAEPGKDYGPKYEVVIEGSYVERPGVFYGRACLREKGETAAADGGECEARFNQLKDVCLAQANKASTDCDQENEGIQQAMDATKAVGAGSAVSMKMACSKLGQISKIANLSLTGWQSFCAYSQGSCESSCSDTMKLYNQTGCIADAAKPNYAGVIKEIRENITTCVSYKKRISEAAQHATAALMQAQAAKKCEDDTGDGLTTASVDECKKNPNNPLCTDAQKCSNPTFAASNKVCQCISNPNSKDCIAATGGAGSRGVAGSTIPGVGGGGSKTDPAAAFIPPSASGENPFATDLRNGAKTNEQNLGGAKGNAGLGGGSGGSAGGGAGSNPYGAGSAGADGDKSKINSGFYGGGTGAGGGYFGKTATGPGGSGGRANAGGVNYNKMAGGAQFDPRRYIAGLNGKGGEYINGPNMDIFKIVKNRIEAKKPSMLDPDFKK